MSFLAQELRGPLSTHCVTFSGPTSNDQLRTSLTPSMFQSVGSHVSRLLKLSPPHGWPAVGWELLIVTLGVLIALAAQQWVEDRSSKSRAAAAEQAMVLEIENSLLASAELVRLDRCWDTQFLGLENAIVSGDNSAAQIVKAGSIGGTDRLWADNAFQAALSSQVSEYLGSEKLKRYSQVYDMIRKARVAQSQWQENIAVLGTLAVPSAPRSPEITHSLLTALSKVRASKRTMQKLGALIVMFAKKDLKLEVTQSQYLSARDDLSTSGRVSTKLS